MMLGAALLWLMSALFHAPVAVGALVAVVAGALVAPRRFRRWVLALGVWGGSFLLLLSVFFVLPGFPCPAQSGQLRWLDRSAPAYDAWWISEKAVVVGRAQNGPKSGLLLLQRGRLKSLFPAKKVQGLLVRGKRLLATDWAGHRLVRFTVGAGPKAEKLCRFPIDLAALRKEILVLCEGDQKLVRLSGWPPKPVRTYALPSRMNNPYGLAVNEEKDLAYVSNWGLEGGVVMVDLKTGSARWVSVGGSAMGLLRVPQRGELWLAQPLAGRVLRLDENTLRPVGHLNTSLGARRLSLNGEVVGVVSYFDGMLETWDVATLKKMAKMPVGRLARGIRPAPGGFVVCSGCGVARVKLALKNR